MRTKTKYVWICRFFLALIILGSSITNAKSGDSREGPDIEIGGALWTNYSYQDFNKTNKGKGGELNFDLIRLDINGSFNDIVISAQYRWYSNMAVIHHGWIGYNLNTDWQIQFGVTQAPFGILPYASHSYWFGVPYYIGMEDDYDTGIKVVGKEGPWDFSLAFFKNAEWGNSGKTDRYSFDIVRDENQGQYNEEANQGNARLAYTLEHNDFGKTEIGISGRWGGLFNTNTNDMGYHYAYAVHLNGFYGPFNLMLEAAHYQYNPQNPSGTDSKTVFMGAFEDSYSVASEGTVLIADVSWDVPVSLGPISKLTFYNDYSVLLKQEDSYHDSHINTVGVMISAVPVYVYIDAIIGKNMVWLGGPLDALAAGKANAGWKTRFNINIEYFF